MLPLISIDGYKELEEASKQVGGPVGRQRSGLVVTVVSSAPSPVHKGRNKRNNTREFEPDMAMGGPSSCGIPWRRKSLGRLGDVHLEGYLQS